MSEAVRKFNGLNAAGVGKKEVIQIADLAKKEGQKNLYERLKLILESTKDISDAVYCRSTPAIEQVSEYDLPGIDEMPSDITPADFRGLNKAVTPDDIYQYITNLMINTIKKVGTLPWQVTWDKTAYSEGTQAINFESKKPYRGINFFLLNFETKIDPKTGERYLLPRKFQNPYFLTFNQIQKFKGKLNKGSKGTRIVYFTRLYQHSETHKDGKKLEFSTYNQKKFIKWIKQNQNNLEILKNPSWTIERLSNKYIPILKYYNVFSAEDITGIDWGELPGKTTKNKTEAERIEAAEAVIKAMPNAPDIMFGGNQPAYYPKTDHILIPGIDNFNSPQEYYSTMFHELIHSTGHANRLKRLGVTLGKLKTKRDYAFEELIAEMGAVFLCGETGILFHVIDNSAAYLRSWNSRLVKNMEEDNRFYFRAASASQAAADYILDRDKDGQPAYLKNLPKVELKKTPKEVLGINGDTLDPSKFKGTLNDKGKTSYFKRNEIVWFKNLLNKAGTIAKYKVTKVHEVPEDKPARAYHHYKYDLTAGGGNILRERSPVEMMKIEDEEKPIAPESKKRPESEKKKPYEWTDEELKKEIEKLDPYEHGGYRVDRLAYLKEILENNLKAARIAFELRDFYEDRFIGLNQKPLSSLEMYYFNGSKTLKEYVIQQIKGAEAKIKSKQKDINKLSNSKTHQKQKKFYKGLIESSRVYIKELKDAFNEYEKEKAKRIGTPTQELEKPHKPIDLEIKKPTRKQPKNEFKVEEIIAMWKTRGKDFITLRKGIKSYNVTTRTSHGSENTLQEALKHVENKIEAAQKYDGKRYHEVFNKVEKKPLKNNFFSKKYKANVEDIVKMLNAEIRLEKIEKIHGISKSTLKSKEFIGDLLVANANEKAGLITKGAYGIGKLPLEHLKIAPRRIQKKNPVEALSRIVKKGHKNMSGVFVDSEGYVATDSHILCFIPAKVKKGEVGKIINVNPKISETKEKFIDAKFPNWRVVIPEWYSVGETEFFDLRKLTSKVNAIVNALTRVKKYAPYIALNNKKFVNPFLLLDMLLVLSEAGEKKVKFYSEQSLHRAIVLKTENNLKGIIMPVRGELEESVGNIKILPDFAKGLAAPNSNTSNQETIFFKKKGLKKPEPEGGYRHSGESTRPHSSGRHPKVQNISVEIERSPLFNIAGETAKFLQAVEKKPVDSVVITLDGPQGSGKTTAIYRFQSDFAVAGNRCLFASLEEHPQSNLALEKRDQYITPESQKNIDVIAEFDNYKEFCDIVEDYDAIFIDSWQKLQRMIGNIRLDEDIRKKFNGKVFFIIFQQTTTGRTKGGAEIVFDGDIIIKLERFESFADNYAYFDKNRYTTIPIENLKYMILDGVTIIAGEEPTPAPEEIKPFPEPEENKKIKYNFKVYQ